MIKNSNKLHTCIPPIQLKKISLVFINFYNFCFLV